MRILAGSPCHRDGECWLVPARNYAPSYCQSGPNYACNPHGCTVYAPCFPDFWNLCPYPSTCYDSCTPAPTCQ